MVKLYLKSVDVGLPKLAVGMVPSPSPTPSRVGEGVTSPFLLLVNHVLIRCSVMPSVSPSGP